MIKKRNGFVAGAFNALCPGLGFLYLGRVRWAVGMMLAFPLILALAAWTKLVFVPVGFLATALLMIGAWLCSVIIAVSIARNSALSPLHRSQSWYFYVAFFVLATLFSNSLRVNRPGIFGYEIFGFPSGSMREALIPGDYFISNAWKYETVGPQRGDLVVFIPPGESSTKYVKRVIGLPGETVELDHGEVRVNGILITEPYVSPSNNRGVLNRDGKFEVPSNSYFLLGDNRDNSRDSRAWGAVPHDKLRGSVEFICFSFNSTDGLRTERFGQRVR